jgi:hypothetical protein
MDIRAIVLERLQERGLSRYWLAQQLHRDGVAPGTVYRWLAGKGDTTATVAGLALEALRVSVSSDRDVWGTVRTADGVTVCRVGSAAWNTGTYRVVHGTRENAEKSRSERLKYLTGGGR